MDELKRKWGGFSWLIFISTKGDCCTLTEVCTLLNAIRITVNMDFFLVTQLLTRMKLVHQLKVEVGQITFSLLPTNFKLHRDHFQRPAFLGTHWIARQQSVCGGVCQYSLSVFLSMCACSCLVHIVRTHRSNWGIKKQSSCSFEPGHIETWPSGLRYGRF